MLRIGINFGNTLLTGKDEAGTPTGIAPDLARELARRLGESMSIVEYDSAGRMADGARTGEWDVAFLATDPERAKEIRFSAPYLEVDTTYLVRDSSHIHDIGDIDRAGIRISVSAKSAYDLFLTRELTNAQLVRAATPPASIDLFFDSNLEALAGLRPFLVGVARKHSNVRILDGRFSVVHQAVGMPRSSTIRFQTLQQFVDDIKDSGLVAQLIAKHHADGATVCR